MRACPWRLLSLLLLQLLVLEVVLLSSSPMPATAVRVHQRPGMRLEPCYPPPCPGYTLAKFAVVSPDAPGGAGQSLPASSPPTSSRQPASPPAFSPATSTSSGSNSPDSQSQAQPAAEVEAPSEPHDLSSAPIYDPNLVEGDFLVRVLHAPPMFSEPALPEEATTAMEEIRRLDELTAVLKSDKAMRLVWLGHANRAQTTLERHVEAARKSVQTLKSNMESAKAQQEALRERLARDELLDQLQFAQTRLNELMEQKEPLESKTQELLSRQRRLEETIQELEQGDQLIGSRLNPSDQPNTAVEQPEQGLDAKDLEHDDPYEEERA